MRHCHASANAADAAAAIRRLTRADLGAVVALQAAVTAALPKGYIHARSEDDLLAYLGGARGRAFGLVKDGDLVALSLVRLPGAAQPNAGTPFPRVPASDWALRACFLENTMVLPPARGRGYQRWLFDVRLAHARVAGMNWICAGVHLANRVSWANLLAKGMAIVGLRLDFGYPVIGLLRPVGAPALATEPGERVAVRAGDLAQHQAALDDGYAGVRLSADGTVTYRRLAASAATTPAC